MAEKQARTSNEARSSWKGRVVIGSDSLTVILEEQNLTRPACPSLDSLTRRYEASDKSWQQDWLADDTDPMRPEQSDS